MGLNCHNKSCLLGDLRSSSYPHILPGQLVPKEGDGEAGGAAEERAVIGA